MDNQSEPCAEPQETKVKGTPTDFFQSSRGLRQGDLLSPCLFMLAIEALNCLLERAKEGIFLSRVNATSREGKGVRFFVYCLLMIP